MMDISCVTLDCTDSPYVAGFWSAALRWSDLTIAPDGNSAICKPPHAGAYLEFVRVSETKTIKNRVHLGCSVGNLADLTIELERLISLGATLAWEEDFPPDIAGSYRNVILRDPEGNEFCLGAGTPPE